MESHALSLRIAFLAGSLLCLSLSWTFGCSRDDDDEQPRRARADATARLAAVPGGDGHGFVRFVRADDGVHVIAELAGLPPGEHGLHVHEKGDCSPPDFASAGARFSVSGRRGDAQRPAGDLGNIVVAADGAASIDRFDQAVALDGERSIIGRALIVHLGTAIGSDPGSGERILCGVVERANLLGEHRGVSAHPPAPSISGDAMEHRDHSVPPPVPVTIP